MTRSKPLQNVKRPFLWAGGMFAIGIVFLLGAGNPMSVGYLENAWVGLTLLYLTPGVLAELRKHHQRRTIAVINVLAGWTVIGWIVALGMAASGLKESSA